MAMLLGWGNLNTITAQTKTITALETQSKEGTSIERLEAWHQLAAYYYERDIGRANRRNESAMQFMVENRALAAKPIASLIWSDKAKIAIALGDYEESIEASVKAMELATVSSDNTALVIAYSNLGWVYALKGHSQLAIKYLLQAVKLAEKEVDGILQKQAYQMVGKAYLILYETEQAFYFLERAKRIKTRTSNPSLSLDLGVAYLQQSSIDKAAEIVGEAIGVAKKKGQKRMIAYGDFLLGEIAYANLDWDKADNAYYTALKQYKKLKDQLGEARALEGQSKVKQQQNEPQKAIVLLEKALKIVNNIGAKTPLQNLYKELSSTYNSSGKYEEALMYYRKYTVVKDSILDRDKSRAIAEIQTKHNAKVLKKEKKELEEKTKNQALEIELRNKEINIQELRNNQNFYVILALGIGLGLALIIGFLILRQNGLKSQIRETELEQRALRSQMNPHFMFNSLNSIQSLIAIGDNSAASIYLAKFSRLVRRILQNTRETYIPMQQEIDFLDNYIELEQRRFKEAFDFEVNVTQIEDAHFVMIPPLVIQPFIENAIIHGLLRKKEKGKLLVIFEDYNQDFVKCIVQDNGIGRAAAAKFKSDKKHESLGIKITEQRLAYLTMKQKSNHPLIKVIDLEDEDSIAMGTAVEILLPIKYKA
jgi:tetratricopeptide (TPR) repeat protein